MALLLKSKIRYMISYFFINYVLFALLVDSNLFCEFEIVDSLDCVLALLVDINSICIFVNLMSNILRLNFVFFFLVANLC